MRKTIVALLKNPYLVGYLAAYSLLLLLLHWREGFDLAEPALVFLIVGVGFSALAAWATRKLTPPPLAVKAPRAECGLLAVYLCLLVGFLTWGLNFLQAVAPSEPAQSLAILAAKMTVFVMVPFAMFRGWWKYRLADLAPAPTSWRRHFSAALWMCLTLVAFQLLAGQGASRIRESGLAGWSLVAGIPLAYLWLLLEVGLVEEFFFRVLLQSRVAALLRSEIAGVVVMAVLFGLAHAPGLYFRTSATAEPVGPAPSWLMAIGYSIVVVSVTGFFLGILWSRTRNLGLLMVVHAAGDLVPNLGPILRSWFPG